MTKSQMIAAIAEESKQSKKEVNAVLDAFNEVVIKTLKKEKKVKLQGLGILAVKNRKARIGRNPATGAEIKIPAKRVVKFRVAKDLKDKVL
ncbi:MAG: DNA-binding protein HU [Candidatus Aerophobetes bacterium ADurb.Bin490]|nr:MAG: DNA-binding protein HU [Candidatus Aerophobetes bacterium ADurb.Bin490]HPI02781.1 HU family DNA-binding protein [Candidatus Goldiibacteriota bacterium]HPN63728.1 HU family DNA-binding protein [Candidatus Goldiibacteriota bacterium]HRQ44432.1 HU family DNA-binding protein [Candidatus Goldiibacteriota bacterium]